jgi:hypothetical protein
MVKIKKFLRILFSKNGLTLPQILNLALYKFSPKKPILNYDPITLIIYLTDRCNYQCPFCPHHTKLPKETFPYFHDPVEDFTLEKFKQVIDLFSKNNNDNICWSR